MRKSFILILIIFPVIDIIAQAPNKSELGRLFKNSIEQDSKKAISTYSNPWLADNRNDSYYKSDIITLINSITKNDLKNCQTVNWTFYQKKKFILTKAQQCKEPPSVEVSKKEDWINIKINKTESGLVLELYNNNELKEEFKVLSIEKDAVRTKIILKRKPQKSLCKTA